MEKFWNIIHYIVYKLISKFYHILIKKDPIFNKLYRTEYAKRHFEKKGIDPFKEVTFALTNKRVGQSSFFAATVMISSVFYVFFGLHMYYFILFNNSYVPSAEVFIFPLFLYGILSGVINYYLLFRKDKYLKYFRKFEKEPRVWKIKWAWISFGVILASFMVFGSSIIVIMVGN